MSVNLSVKNVPDELAAKLRARAERNHRSLQGELLTILEAAANDLNILSASALGGVAYARDVTPTTQVADSLLTRLTAIAGDRGIDTTTRLTRDQMHDRKMLRKAGV